MHAPPKEPQMPKGQRNHRKTRRGEMKHPTEEETSWVARQPEQLPGIPDTLDETRSNTKNTVNKVGSI